MAQINLSWLLSLSLSAKNWAECKVQSEHRSAQSSALVSALRLLSSSAVPSARVLGVYHAFLSALFKGDISTLSNKGHFYFGLTANELDASTSHITLPYNFISSPLMGYSNNV